MKMESDKRPAPSAVSAARPPEAPPESALAVLDGEFREVRPVVTPQMAREARQRYLEMVEAVTTEEDYQTFTDEKGRKHKFRKRSGWKALEWAYGASVSITQERIFHLHQPAICLRVKMPEHFKDVEDCGCEEKGVRYVVRATDTRTGRYSENVGICVKGERRVSRKASLHDLATRAFNRGANRSVADLLGVSDPSAEEKQASSGYSKEERTALADAFRAADEDRRKAALGAMEDYTGLDDSSDKEVWVKFLQVGNEEQYSHIMQLLSGENGEDFDPDDVPVEELK